jgi:hypothetical protein
MPKSIFDQIDDIKKGNEPFKWYRNRIKELGSPSQKELVKDGKISGAPNWGRMNFFFYDPKHKKTLPYYDKFPLVIPIEKYKDGFLGINFHYLPYAIRVRLLDEMVNISGAGKLTEKTELNINWKAVSKMKKVRPCIKRYLASHVKSPFRRIDADDFLLAAMLPVHKFEKATSSKVWADSRSKI